MTQMLIQTARDCWKDALHGGVGLGAITVSLKVEAITVWLQIASLCGGILLCLLSLVSVGLTIEQKIRNRGCQGIKGKCSVLINQQKEQDNE